MRARHGEHFDAAGSTATVIGEALKYRKMILWVQKSGRKGVGPL